MSDDVATHLSWVEIQRVLLYCERVRERLGLTDWGVGVSVKKCDDDAHAAIDTKPGKRFACLYLPTDWEGKPKHKKRSTLLHEMLHLAHQRQEHALIADVSNQTDMTKDHEDRILSAYYRESEYMVDGLTIALARVPGFLPAWPNRREAEMANLNNREP